MNVSSVTDRGSRVAGFTRGVAAVLALTLYSGVAARYAPDSREIEATFLFTAEPDPVPERGAHLTGPDAFDRDPAEVVSGFLQSLTATQRERTIFPFDSPERMQWSRTPGERTGIGIASLSDGQRNGAHQMLRSVLSTQGYLKAVNIMLNEDIPARAESGLGPERYWIAIYGDPSQETPWSWRIEGHHLSMHFAFRGARLVSASPMIYGIHPALIESEGARSGLKVLAGEEEIGLALAQALRDAGSEAAFGRGEEPNSLHGESLTVSEMQEGLRVSDMGLTEQRLVRRLIAEYVNNQEADSAEGVVRRVDLADLRFVWYGGLEASTRHYYRLQGHDLLIEYQHYGGVGVGGNHIHCLWRDLSNESGL